MNEALQVLEKLADELEQVLPDIESQKNKSKAAAKALDRTALTNLKTQLKHFEHLEKLLDASDILKGKAPGSWK